MQELKSTSFEESEGNHSIKMTNYLKIDKFYSWMESRADEKAKQIRIGICKKPKLDLELHVKE